MLQMRMNRAIFASCSMSLKKQTQKCILKNKRFFHDLTRLHPDNTPFSRISNIMKKELIELELEMHTRAAEQNFQQELHLQSDLNLEVLKMLLNTKITSFAIPADLVVNGDQITELWQDLMEIRPPDLNTIVWNCNLRFLNAAGVRPFFNSLIAQPVLPPKLVVLRLQPLECNAKDLSNIADRLPNLRVLEVLTLSGVLRLGLFALCRLTFLEEFLFRYSSRRQMEELVELLPNLHIIGSKLEMQKFTDDDDQYLEHKLQHLALDDMDQVLENVSLPELLVLELCSKIAMHPCLVGGSPKLTELYIYKMHQATLMPALGHIGQQLQVLILDLLDLPRLDLVLEACPNLTELHIHTFNGVGYKSQLQADTLKHLQIAEFNVTRGPFDSELLMQILRLASKLRSIEVDSITFVVDDWEMLAELAKEGACMQHLETIKITCRLLSTRAKQSLVAKTRVDFSVSCPKLQVFSCDLVGPPPPPPLDPNPHQCSLQ